MWRKFQIRVTIGKETQTWGSGYNSMRRAYERVLALRTHLHPGSVVEAGEVVEAAVRLYDISHRPAREIKVE